MKVLTKLTIILVLVWVLGGLGRYVILKLRVESHVKKAEQALDQPDLSAAGNHLRFIRSMDETHPDLPLLSARYFSYVSPIHALSFWKQVLDHQPDAEDFRRAYVMTALKARDLTCARKLIEGWPANQTGSADYHQAALAVHFALGDDTRVAHHIQQLSALDPGSEVHRINALRLQALSAESKARSEARSQLLDWLKQEDWQEFALHTLLQSLLLEADTSLLDTSTRVWQQQLDSPTTEMILMMLDARLRANISTEPHELESFIASAWEAAGGESYQQSRILGWLLRASEMELLSAYIQQTNPILKWQYPLGLAVAEYHIATGNPEIAIDKLNLENWEQQEPLRRFLQAFAAEGTRAAEQLLQSAIREALPSLDSLEQLDRIAVRWQWRAGRIQTLRAMLKHPQLSRTSALEIWQELEAMGDTRGLYEATLDLLENNPEHPSLLNNAAYFGTLLKEDPEQCIRWAQQAVSQSSPAASNTQSTLALAYIQSNQASGVSPESAEQMNTSRHPATRLVYALWLKANERPIPVELKNWIAQQTYLLPEETALQKLVLQPD